MIGPGRTGRNAGRARRLASLGSGALFAMLTGCHAARMVAPPPPLRAASAALYAVDVEFAEPLDRRTAEDPTRYAIYPLANPGVAATISSAVLIDTLDARAVQLIIPAWFGDSATDHADYVVEARGILDYLGRSVGTRRVTFRTGLDYLVPPGDPFGSGMKGLFDSRCSSCHGAAQASGSYRTDSYAALFGSGTHSTPDLIAGDPSCLLVRKCKPRNSMFNLAGLSYLDFELIRNWVAVYEARP